MAMKIRRVGNSNVVTVPRELERYGFGEGVPLAFVPLRTGEVLLLSPDRLEEHMGRIGQQVVASRRRALEKLAAHDRSEAPV